MKALSLKFYSLNFLSWPDKSGTSWLKRVWATLTKKCHVNHWTYMVHSWPSWKIAHESLHESHSTVGTALFWLRERQVFIVIVSLGHSMWLMVLMFIKFKSHWCWCLLQSRAQTVLVICDKKNTFYVKNFFNWNLTYFNFRDWKNNIQSSLGTPIMKLILNSGKGWRGYHLNTM